MANNTWVMDPAHSEIEFKVRHMMITNVKGLFNEFSATVDGADLLNENVTVTINANSVYTKNTDRDNHLRSADFFDVEKYPNIIFKSKSMIAAGANEYTLTGDLTIKDVTKEISLHVTSGGTSKDPWGNEKAGFTVEGKISRSEFGLTWNAALETGGVMVSDEVKFESDIQFVKQA